MVNVQHDCVVGNQCHVKWTHSVLQEREVSSEKALEVTHVGMKSFFVLNLGQIHDAALLFCFRPPLV